MQHDGFTAAMPVSRVGATLEVSKPLIGNLDTFAGLEADLARDGSGHFAKPEARAYGGLELRF